MDARTHTRVGLYALLAAVSAGCVAARPDGVARGTLFGDIPSNTRRDKSPGPTVDNYRMIPAVELPPTAAGAVPPWPSPSAAPPAPGPSGVTGTGVVQAGGVTALPAAPIPPLPLPSIPSVPADPPAAPPPVPLVTLPPNPAAAAFTSGTWAGTAGAPYGPHVRGAPSVRGELGLGPNDDPVVKMVGLSQQVKSLSDDRAALYGEITRLRAELSLRNVSVDEAMRDAEDAANLVKRTQAELATFRTDFAALRSRLVDVEREDIVTLRAIVAALQKLVDDPRFPRLP